MKQLRIAIGIDRNASGALRLSNGGGRTVAGPFLVAARATDGLAASNGNPSRDPLFRYGDPPTGTYRILALKPSGSRTALSTAEYGPNGVLLLMPVAGDAALAEANGRYTIPILGGKLSKHGRLRSTAGGFRLKNEDLRALLRAIGPDFGEMTCVCAIESSTSRSAKVDVDEGCTHLDPISTGEMRWKTSRREAVMGAAGTLGVAAGASVLFLSPLFSTPARAQVAYHGPSDFSEGTVHVNAADEPETVATQIGDEVTSSARDLGVDLANSAAGQVVPKASLPWVTPAAQLAGGLTGAAQLYKDGNTDAAVQAVKTTLADAMPEVVSSAATTALAPALVETVVAVAIGTAALGVTLSTSAIVVTSIVVVVGVNTAISFGSKKLTRLGIAYIKSKVK